MTPPTRPPVPPCPGYSRHLFGGSNVCARCGRIRRRWSDYDCDGDGRLKRLLYGWLRSEVPDDGSSLAQAIHALGYGVGQAHGIIAVWRMVRDGGDLDPYPPCDRVELWEDDAGGLYVHGEGQAIVFAGLEHALDATFSEDAVGVANGDTGNWTVPHMYPPDDGPNSWPWQAATLVAVWSRDSGARLTPESVDAWGGHPGRAACRYLDLPGPEWIGTGEAARIIGCDPSQVRRLVDDDVVAGRKRGHDLECDPLSVRWYAGLSRGGRSRAAARAMQARLNRRQGT